MADIAALTQRMLEAGASEQGRIARCTSGPATGCLAVYLKDPNGIIVELVERPARGDRSGPPGAASADGENLGERDA